MMDPMTKEPGFRYLKDPKPWLESDDEFEGVGAHADNPRYDPVDEEDD